MGQPRPPLTHTDPRQRRLDPRMRAVWTIELAIAALFTVAPAAIAGVVLGVPIVVPAAVVLIAAAFVWWFPRTRYDHWSYELAPTTIELRYGVFLRAELSVPYFRVQHVEMEQGPIERRLGVAKLRMKTASPSATVPLPGLSTVDAGELRATILERASSGDDAV